MPHLICFRLVHWNSPPPPQHLHTHLHLQADASEQLSHLHLHRNYQHNLLNPAASSPSPNQSPTTFRAGPCRRFRASRWASTWSSCVRTSAGRSSRRSSCRSSRERRSVSTSSTASSSTGCRERRSTLPVRVVLLRLLWVSRSSFLYWPSSSSSTVLHSYAPVCPCCALCSCRLLIRTKYT